MRRLFLFGIIITNSFLVNGQSRQNPEKSLIIREFNSWMTGSEILGWDFNDDEWENREGYLRVGGYQTIIDINEKYDSPLGETKSKTPQNIDEIGLLEVSYKDENYVAIGVKKYEGKYKYPSIKKDWHYYTSYYVYVFEIDEFKKIKTIDGLLELKPLYVTYGDSLQKDKEFQSCYKNLKFLFENESYDQWKMMSKKTTDEGNEVFRFLLPEKMSKYAEAIDFEKHYFEVSINKFNELRSMLE